MHEHECDRCGTVWTHEMNSHGISEAHRCPKCGTFQWWKRDAPISIRRYLTRLYFKGITLFKRVPRSDTY